MHRIITSIVIVAISTSVACTNRNYSDLMRVTGETEAQIQGNQSIYAGNCALSERVHARDRIITLRKKQMIMAQRINVKTMPDVKTGKITQKEGEDLKAQLVASATERYEAALAMPVPTK